MCASPWSRVAIATRGDAPPALGMFWGGPAAATTHATHHRRACVQRYIDGRPRALPPGGTCHPGASLWMPARGSGLQPPHTPVQERA